MGFRFLGFRVWNSRRVLCGFYKAVVGGTDVEQGSRLSVFRVSGLVYRISSLGFRAFKFTRRVPLQGTIRTTERVL